MLIYKKSQPLNPDAGAGQSDGIDLIGFGTESTLLMGGADIAVARDTSALNTNPAGLTQIQGQTFDSFASGRRTFDLSHRDSFGNDKHADNRYSFLGGGYAVSLDSIPCTVGIGLFSQGGAGGVFKNINTAFGNRDDISSLFGMAKISPGLGCRINDNWSVGPVWRSLMPAWSRNFSPIPRPPLPRLPDIRSTMPLRSRWGSSWACNIASIRR